MSATVGFVDTNVIVRHLVGTPAAAAERATRCLMESHILLVPDLVIAETAYVLASVYRVPRAKVAQALRSVVTLPSVRTPDRDVLLRGVEVFEKHRLDFAEAYLVALAEASGVGSVVSFDRDYDRLDTVTRIEP